MSEEKREHSIPYNFPPEHKNSFSVDDKNDEPIRFPTITRRRSLEIIPKKKQSEPRKRANSLPTPRSPRSSGANVDELLEDLTKHKRAFQNKVYTLVTVRRKKAALESFIESCNISTENTQLNEDLIELKWYVYDLFRKSKILNMDPEKLPAIYDRLSIRTDCTDICLGLYNLIVGLTLILIVGFALATGGAALLGLFLGALGITGAAAAATSAAVTMATMAGGSQLLAYGSMVTAAVAGLITYGVYAAAEPKIMQATRDVNELEGLFRHGK